MKLLSSQLKGRAELLVHSIHHSLSISIIQVFFLRQFSHCMLSNHYSLFNNHAADSFNVFWSVLCDFEKFSMVFSIFFLISFLFRRSERELCGRFSTSFLLEGRYSSVSWEGCGFSLSTITNRTI